MAKFYGKLKGLDFSLESKPVEVITEQKWSDSLFIIRGNDDGIPAWHYVLIPHHKLDDLKSKKTGDTIDCTKFGCVIKYRDDHSQIHPASGWGINPPQLLQIWIEEHYDHVTFDKDTIFQYEKDDIRLCTMQRMTPSQLIGIYRYYHKQGHFHYIKLFDDFQSSLAYRSGLRNFDRFISFNGINIEQDTLEELIKRFKTQLHLPVQMLVCSPATYQYYKSNNRTIHSNLPTVQHLKPVFDISTVIEENFCVVQWVNSNIICIVSQASIFKSPDFTNVNDICIIEVEGQYRKGQIKYKGSQDQCEFFLTDLITRLSNGTIDRYIFNCESNEDQSISKPNTIASENEKTRFEDLPNELLFDLFNYLTLEDLHHAFNDLNYRFNNLLLSRHNVSMIFDKNTNPLLIKLYGFEIMHLTIDTSNQCNLNEFVNLRSLTLRNRNLKHIKQIQPEILPNLVYLSFKLKSDFKPPNELIDDIFNNRFSKLRYVNLGCIETRSSKTWSIVPSLQIIFIHCDQSMIVQDILAACPNLKLLQLQILYNSKNIIASTSSFTHSLERFTLWSDKFELTLDLIDNLLSNMPNLKHLYLQTKLRVPFIQLITNLCNRLHYLIRFDCFIKEVLIKNDRIGNLNDVHQISSCFNRIKCIKENEEFRIFATE